MTEHNQSEKRDADTHQRDANDQRSVAQSESEPYHPSPYDDFERRFQTWWNQPVSRKWHGINRIVQFVLLLVTAAYVVVTFWLWQESATQTANSNRAIEDARRAHEIDQRAWLYLDHAIDHEPRGIIDNSIDFVTISFPVTNTGKTPALRVRFVPVITYEKQPELPSEPHWSEIARSNDDMYSRAAEIYKLPPGTRFDHIVTIFPGTRQQQFFSPGAGSLVGEWLDDYRGHRRSIRVWTRLDYCDVFGKAHWTKTCAVHVSPDKDNPSRFTYCAWTNGIQTDDNSPEKSDYNCKS